MFGIFFSEGGERGLKVIIYPNGSTRDRQLAMRTICSAYTCIMRRAFAKTFVGFRSPCITEHETSLRDCTIMRPVLYIYSDDSCCRHGCRRERVPPDDEGARLYFLYIIVKTNLISSTHLSMVLTWFLFYYVRKYISGTLACKHLRGLFSFLLWYTYFFVVEKTT